MKAAIYVPPERERRRKNYFARACFAQVRSRLWHLDVEKFISPGDDVTPRILQRAIVAPGSTTTVGWAAETAHDAFKDFIADMAPYNAAARLIAKAVPARSIGADEVKYPVRANGPTVPGWVAENGGIPIRSSDFDLIAIGPARKMAHILVWSKELSERTDAEAIFEQMLREDVGAGLDAALLSTSAGSSSAHAGLLNGVTPIAGWVGGDEQAMKQDFGTLAVAVATGGSGNVMFIMAPERLARLRVIAPVLAASIDIAPSAAVPADRVIAADAGALLVAIDPEPEILQSTEATLHMSDVPLEIVSHTGPTTADPVRSLWQTATTAARVLHDIAFAKRRATAVAYVDGASW